MVYKEVAGRVGTVGRRDDNPSRGIVRNVVIAAEGYRNGYNLR